VRSAPRKPSASRILLSASLSSGLFAVPAKFFPRAGSSPGHCTVKGAEARPLQPAVPARCRLRRRFLDDSAGFTLRSLCQTSKFGERRY